jgi:hypothetical protein
LQLLRCSKEAEVEAVFAKNNIDTFAVKTELLHIAMQLEATYNTPAEGVTLSDEEIYKYYLELFCDGKWKDFI